jgi:hypothetical protein
MRRKERQGIEDQQAFLYFFRFNIQFFTVLLQAFYEGIRNATLDGAENDDYADKLTPCIRRLLPVMRLYNSWLTCNLHLVDGLKADTFLGDSIDTFWSSYARAIDLLADDDIFGIWAFDDVDVPYMLEEDVDTLGFLPLLNAQQTVDKNWKHDGVFKARFSELGLERLSVDDEMLGRAKSLLEDGSNLAISNDLTPLGIVNNRIYYGQALLDAIAVAEEAKKRPPEPPRPLPQPKPISYAAAAKSGQSISKPQPKADSVRPPASKSRSRQAQVTRMVDNLLEDDDGNIPVTPPQQHIAHPAVVANGDGIYHPPPYTSHADFANATSYQPKPRSPQIMQTPKAITVPTPPTLRTPQNTLAAQSVERMQSVSRLWPETTATSPIPTSPSAFPSGLPTGTLGSPPDMQSRGYHSRVNSANSIRSRTSQNVNMAESWSSSEFAGPKMAQQQAVGSPNGYSKFSASGVGSPLLFGAGGGIWSTGQAGLSGVSPSNGQG